MSFKVLSSIRAQSFGHDSEEDVYDDGRLRVEHDNYYVSCDGRAIELGRSEFLLISRLVRNPARVVPSEELWQCAWNGHKPYNPVSLRVYIYRLRGKLEPFGIRIETMINVGYRLLPAVSLSQL